MKALMFVVAMCIAGLAQAQQAVIGQDSTETIAVDATVMYRMAEASARVKNPMMMKMGHIGVATSVQYAADGKKVREGDVGRSFWDIFRQIEDQPEKFEIIQIVRNNGVLAFLYIEKEYVAPPSWVRNRPAEKPYGR